MEIAIKENIQKIASRIETACYSVGRKPEEVKLLLATKTVSAEKIKIAFEKGYTLIGENKINEIKEKYEDLREIKHETHFIGHLQTNKVKDLLRYDVSVLQSLDRIKLAQKLQNRLEFEDKTMDVFLQFNTSNEKSKFGMDPKEALKFALEVEKFERIHIKGLMTIGLFSAETEKVRKCFQLLKEIQTTLLNNGISAHELSMGMSGDLETAIEEGATIIRVGTAAFGKRKYPDSYYWNEQS